jgi:Flp pilus assembly pilin Flp
MLKLMSRFHRDEDGAVTVDWVVLTAAIVGLGVSVIAMVSAGATDYSTSIGNQLSNQSILTY